MSTKIVFRVEGMHCTSCGMAIDGELEDTEGVVSANTSYAKQETEVEFDPTRVSEQQIIETIKNVGYDAHPSQ